MIRGVYVTDDETRQTIADVYRNHGYFLDPHGAVGWTAADKQRKDADEAAAVVVAATAHPAKFSETVERITGPVPVPASIQKAMDRTASAATIPPDLSALRDILLSGL